MNWFVIIVGFVVILAAAFGAILFWTLGTMTGYMAASICVAALGVTLVILHIYARQCYIPAKPSPSRQVVIPAEKKDG
jgi:hypothetical protein